MKINYNNITTRFYFDENQSKKNPKNEFIITLARKLHWSEQVYFLYQNKDFLDTNKRCPVCGANHYDEIKEAKDTYYSVDHTDYHGKNMHYSGLFSSSSHYQPINKVKREKRVKHNYYHCTNCQTDFEMLNEFDLLLYFNGFSIKHINIFNYQKLSDELSKSISYLKMFRNSEKEVYEILANSYLLNPNYIKNEILERIIYFPIKD